MDKRDIAIDLAALALYLIVANPALTGISIHEWLGLALLALFLVHASLHVDWAHEALKTAATRPTWVRTGNLALDVLIFVAFMVVVVSGLLISGAVLPAFGLYAQGYYFWDPLHAMSAKALLALLLVHVVVHWRWLTGMFRKGVTHE